MLLGEVGSCPRNHVHVQEYFRDQYVLEGFFGTNSAIKCFHARFKAVGIRTIKFTLHSLHIIKPQAAQETARRLLSCPCLKVLGG